MHDRSYAALSEKITIARRHIARREYYAIGAADAALRRQELRYKLAANLSSDPLPEYWSAFESGDDRWRIVATNAWNHILARAWAAVDCLSANVRVQRLRSGRTAPPPVLGALRLAFKLIALSHQFERPHVEWRTRIAVLRAIIAEVEKIIGEFVPDEDLRAEATRRLNDMFQHHIAELGAVIDS
jgi:hypothetical protein